MGHNAPTMWSTPCDACIAYTDPVLPSPGNSRANLAPVAHVRAASVSNEHAKVRAARHRVLRKRTGPSSNRMKFFRVTTTLKKTGSCDGVGKNPLAQ